MSTFRECARRAVRTFLQAALGYAAASLAGLIEGGTFTKSAASGLLISAVAAGLAAAMNLPWRTAGDNTDNETKEDHQ